MADLGNTENSQKFISILNDYYNSFGLFELNNKSLSLEEIFLKADCLDLLQNLTTDELFYLRSYYYLRNRTLFFILNKKYNKVFPNKWKGWSIY